MGYYIIRLDSDASNISIIILPWGKYSYLQLLMGVACSRDIFQANIPELMATLEFIQTYIDDLLYITKGSLDDHLAKLRRVLIRLQDTGLKVNACKSFFVTLRQNTYDLSYPERLSNQNKKVHAILALGCDSVRGIADSKQQFE